MKKHNLDGINMVRFCDYGGCYGFWTDYNRLENGN